MAQPSALVKILAPRVPGMLKTALWHSLSLSDTSDKWDLRTALIVTTLRGIIGSSSSSITKQQSFGLKDPGVKGNMWVARVEVPLPLEDDARQLLFRAIDDLNDAQGSYTRPDSHAVTAEWTGYRSSVAKDAPEPTELSEEQKYKSLMDEVKSDVTVLYFHGGAYYLMDPASHRGVTSKLAKKTKGRVLSVRYRLAPQNPFPSALLDALYAYLYLLYPPPGSFHRAVPPEQVVFAGDSAGGNLSLVLLQLLLQFHRMSPSSPPTVTYNGQNVAVPLPGGCATNSAWCDITHSMPSMTSNAKYDYLPVPNHVTAVLPQGNPSPPATSSHKRHAPPPCDAWPARPPRADLFCDGSMMCHPLVSPLAAKPEHWRGSPPLFFCQGEEMLSDEGRVLARRAASQGVVVHWEGFEGMPHCFAMVLEGNDMARRCFKAWADSIRAFVERDSAAPLTNRAVWCKALSKGEVELDMQSDDFIAITDEDCRTRMQAGMERKEGAFQAEQRENTSRL